MNTKVLVLVASLVLISPAYAAHHWTDIHGNTHNYNSSNSNSNSTSSNNNSSSATVNVPAANNTDPGDGANGGSGLGLGGNTGDTHDVYGNDTDPVKRQDAQNYFYNHCQPYIAEQEVYNNDTHQFEVKSVNTDAGGHCDQYRGF